MKVMKEHWTVVGRTSFPLLAYFVTMGKFISLCEKFAYVQCIPGPQVKSLCQLGTPKCPLAVVASIAGICR